jgi:hypothetical protein
MEEKALCILGDLLTKLTFFSKKYKYSWIKALRAIFPDYDWKIWKFKRVTPGYWDDEKNTIKFLTEFQKEARLKGPETWNSNIQLLSF